MKKNNFLTKAFTLLFVALFSLTGARAQTVVSDVTASHIGPTDVTLSWTGNATTLRYRVAGASTTYTFDNSQLGQWTTFSGWSSNSAPSYSYYSGWSAGHDRKFVWAIYSTDMTYHSYQAGTGLGRNESTDMVVSGSFCGNSDDETYGHHALTPNNYLVSPQVTLGGAISFWAKGMDPSACAEQFGVFYSTNYNASRPRSATWTQVGSTKTATSEWTQYVFDLGSLSGTGYVAIRHYNCEDQDMLCVDDIVLTAPGGDWTTVTIPSVTSYNLTELNSTTNYQVEVQVGNGGNRRWIGTSFSTTNYNPVPSEVSANPVAAQTATINWWGIGESYLVEYRKDAKDGPQYFFDDFEDGLGKWTIRRGTGAQVPDGMSEVWEIENPNESSDLKFTSHSGDNAAVSFSWRGTPYTANNWLISPAVIIGKKVKFWVRTNPGYPDKYEVLLSTSGNTINDFSGTNSYTLRAMAPANRIDGWERISLTVPDNFVDRSGYIAIHHQDDDANYLFIDDFGIFEDDVPGSDEWQSVTTGNLSVGLTGLIPNTQYEYRITSNKSGVDPATATTQIFTFTTLPLENLALVDDGENSEIVTALGGATVKTVTLPSRTLKANTWNTLCLPITLISRTGTALANADIRQLSSATYDSSTKTLTLNFTQLANNAKIVAGTPYIIKPNGNNNITNISFTNAQIRAGMNPVVINLVQGEDVNLMFRGTYDKRSFSATDRSILFLKSNKLVFPVEGSYFNAQRAYFEFKGIQVSSAIGNLIKEFVVNLDDEDPTGISELFGIEENGTWYDLNGRKLSGKPAQKGIYINNGKKTIIK